MENFNKTPSFYNNEEVFAKYLKATSYYKALQDCLMTIVKITYPKNVVELGSATGASTFFLAEKFSDKTFEGYDFRENIVEEARKLNKFKNVSFKCLDMLDYAKLPTNADFIFMLYAFHHILDPLQNKIDFLENLYKNVKNGTYVCIMETFIPEEIKLEDCDKIVNLWKLRSEEGYASTLWSVLKDNALSDESFKMAKEIATFSKENEFNAGLLVAKRKDEYLVHKSWVKQQAERIGWKVILSQAVNTIGEGVILLQK